MGDPCDTSLSEHLPLAAHLRNHGLQKTMGDPCDTSLSEHLPLAPHLRNHGLQCTLDGLAQRILQEMVELRHRISHEPISTGSVLKSRYAAAKQMQNDGHEPFACIVEDADL